MPAAHFLTLKAASAAPAAPTYSISALAQEFALTTRAIRFYEDEGLLAPARRGQTRIYGERERTRIKLILRGKRLGLALSEIRELFDIYAAAGNERPQLVKFVQMLADRRAMLLQHVWDLHFDPTTNVIDVYVGRVRKKIDDHQAYPLIHTVRGVGFCVRAPS